MKKIIITICATLFFTACKDPNIDSENKTKAELLVSHGWKLDKFTDLSGNVINDGSLNSGAKMLYGMAFDFKSNQEVRGVDKLTKNIINRGQWSLNEKELLNIDIVGFKGDFEVVKINKTTMTLTAQTENHLLGVGPEVNMVFSEFKL